MIKFIDRLYGWFLVAANSLQSPLLLAIRLYWGWQFWQAGHGKLGNISKTVEFFTNLNIPAPSLNAHFVAYLEAGGGILLAIGLGSRLIALPLAIDMIVAYLTADRDSLRAIFSDDPRHRRSPSGSCPKPMSHCVSRTSAASESKVSGRGSATRGKGFSGSTEMRRGRPNVSTVKGELVPTTSMRFCSVFPSVSIFKSTGMRKRSRS